MVHGTLGRPTVIAGACLLGCARGEIGAHRHRREYQCGGVTHQPRAEDNRGVTTDPAHGGQSNTKANGGLGATRSELSGLLQRRAGVTRSNRIGIFDSD